MNKMLHTPEGVKDYLINEYKAKRQTEAALMDKFMEYGFAPIQTPTFEYAEVFENIGSVSNENMFRILDRDGSMLALTPDMTPSIARVVATGSLSKSLPAKLCYVQNMFRHSRNYQGKLREFTQAGVELIGDGSSKADCEIINLALESMAAAVGVKGMSGFRIDIGHAEFLKGALEETGISESDKAAIQSAIIDKNYVEVEELVDRLVMAEKLKELFKNLPLLIGGTEVLDRAESLVTNEASLGAIKYLRDIYAYLEGNGCGDYISFDLGVIGTMDYYTGIIFRGYLRGVGSSVVDGGRYDKLVARFGVDLPAVGFAIKVNSVGMRG